MTSKKYVEILVNSIIANASISPEKTLEAYEKLAVGKATEQQFVTLSTAYFTVDELVALRKHLNSEGYKTEWGVSSSLMVYLQ